MQVPAIKSNFSFNFHIKGATDTSVDYSVLTCPCHNCIAGKQESCALITDVGNVTSFVFAKRSPPASYGRNKRDIDVYKRTRSVRMIGQHQREFNVMVRLEGEAAAGGYMPAVVKFRTQAGYRIEASPGMDCAVGTEVVDVCWFDRVGNSLYTYNMNPLCTRSPSSVWLHKCGSSQGCSASHYSSVPLASLLDVHNFVVQKVTDVPQGAAAPEGHRLFRIQPGTKQSALKCINDDKQRAASYS